MLIAAAAMRHHPRTAQAALVQAFYFTLPAERAATGVSLAELGRQLEAGADLDEDEAAKILRGLSALILLPYDQAVPVMRGAVQAIDDLDGEGLLRYGVISVVLTSALWDAPGRRDCLERTAAAARNAGSLRLLDQVLWAMSMAELRGGTPRRAAAVHRAGPRPAACDRLRPRARAEPGAARLDRGAARESGAGRRGRRVNRPAAACTPPR